MTLNFFNGCIQLPNEVANVFSGNFRSIVTTSSIPFFRKDAPFTLTSDGFWSSRCKSTDTLWGKKSQRAPMSLLTGPFPVWII